MTEEMCIQQEPEVILPVVNLKRERKFCSRIGLNFFIFFLVTTVLQGVVTLVVLMQAPQILMLHFQLFTALMMAQMYVVGYPLLCLLSKKQQTVKPEQHSMNGGNFMVLLMMCFAVLVVGNIIGILVNAGIGYLKGSPVTDSLDGFLYKNSIWVNIGIVGIIGPIFEELMFRKLLIDRLLRYGEAAAIVVSGMMFGLFHGNFSQFFYATFLGFLQGFAYVKTGKLKYSIFIHIIINMSSVLLLPAMQMLDAYRLEDLKTMIMNKDPLVMQFAMEHMGDVVIPQLIILVYDIVLYGIAIAGIVLLIKHRKEFVCKEGIVTLPKGKKFSVIWCNAGMILFVLVCLLMFITVIWRR